MLRWLLIVVAGTAAGLACTAGSLFQCETDQQCQADGGVCEATGYCSFPDADCESGQRYGEYAGGLAGECVVNDNASTGGVAATSVGPAATTSGTTPGVADDGTTGSVTSDAPGTTGAPVSNDSSGGTTTDAPPADCWTETFEDDLLGLDWWDWEDVVGMTSMGGGEAVIELEPTAGAWAGMGSDARFDLSNATAYWELGDVPDVQGPEAFGVAMSPMEGGSVYVEIGNGTIGAGYWANEVSTELLSTPLPAGTITRVELVGSGNSMHLYVTDDRGVDYDVGEFDLGDTWDPTALTVEFYAGAGEASFSPGRLQVDEVGVCG
jgi:hypothetical protein